MGWATHEWVNMFILSFCCNLTEKTCCLSVYYNSSVNLAEDGSTGPCRDGRKGMSFAIFRTRPVPAFSQVIRADPCSDSVRKYHRLPFIAKFQIGSERDC